MSKQKETYIGDGVYVGNDGYQITLRVDGRGTIYLEPGVFSGLIKYAEEFFRVKITVEHKDETEPS